VKRAAKSQRATTDHPVTVAWIHPGEIANSFAFSTMRMLVYEIGTTQTCPSLLCERVGAGQIVRARNDVVKDFLQRNSEYLLFIDSDMGYPPEALQSLLQTARTYDLAVTGALCFAHRRSHPTDDATQAERCEQVPTLYKWIETEDTAGFQTVVDYPRNTVCTVDGTGAAFLLISRKILEKIAEEFGETWFDQIQHPKRKDPFGEDLSFCIRVAAAGGQIAVDTAVKTAHDKGGIFLTEEMWDVQQFVYQQFGVGDQNK